jgi:hypothetical protein
MSQTYVEMYQNEVRAVQVSIRDQDDDIFEPTAAYAKVVDSNGNIVSSETSAMVSSNTMTTLIDTDVTASDGDYEIIWKILKTSGSQTYTYYHKTHITVKEL